MKLKNEYIVLFKGLKDGIHHFEFIIDGTFFSENPSTDIEEGYLNVNVELNKHTTFLELDIEIAGYVTLICDRCLDKYSQDVGFNDMLYVKFGEESGNENDEILILSEDAYEIDLSHYFYESINLSLPLKRVHPEDNEGNLLCNEEMISKLEEHQGIHPESDKIDPRWNGLKDLLSDN